ncbi:MAG TPA: MFS transporter [Candidatus Limnocylindria bacterium]|nr:MFS transporter [Candidatus Limnocylindria bacterium]
MLRLLRNRNFRLLWLGGLVSLMGDWALVVALPFEGYRRTDSTLATAGIVLASLVPAFLLSSPAGVLVDRWNRRNLMVWVNAMSAVALLPLMLVDALGLWVIYAVLVAMTVLKQLFIPAEVALLPLLVGREDLVAANSLSSLNRNLARLVGPAIGGATVAFGGLLAVIAVDSASFVLAAGLIALIPAGAGAATLKAAAADGTDIGRGVRAAIRRGVAEWQDGLRRVWSDLGLRAMLLFALVTGLGEGVVGALFVPWVSDILGGDDAAFAALLSAQALGGLIGAFVLARLFHRASAVRLAAFGAALFGLIDLAIFGYPIFVRVVWPAIVGMVLVGIPGTAMQVGLTTLQQTLTSDSHRGRAIGLYGTIAALGMLVGTVSAGFLGETIGILQMLVVQGSGYILGGLIIAVSGMRARAPDGVGSDSPR